MTTVVAMTTTTTSSSNVVILAVIIVVVVVITQATWLSFIMFCRLDMHLVSYVCYLRQVPRPTLCDLSRFVCHSVTCLCARYCKCNQPISLKLGLPIGIITMIITRELD